MSLPDIQDQIEPRGISLDMVGIAGVRYPVRFRDGRSVQSGVATIDMGVALAGDRRGTHMSRMVELIHDYLQDLDPREINRTLKSAAVKLDVDDVRFAVAMPFVSLVESPASGRQSWQPSDVTLHANWGPEGSRLRTVVTSEVTSLCPCSKAISDYGAHNQRSSVTLEVVGRGDDLYPMPVSVMIEMIRDVGSCPIYPMVKRPDERAITMQAFNHPAFVEDMARDLSERVRSYGLEHMVRVRNFESIHSHDAVASVAWRG